MIKDVLIGVAVAWISLTPEGKAVRRKAVKKLAETYLLPKEPKKEEVKENDNAST